MTKLTATIISPAALTVAIGSAQILEASIAANRAWDTYSGPTTVTPSDQTQILSTAYKNVASDIVINPIPSNYGRISYNGAVLTVS